MADEIDPDAAEPEGYELAVPFVVCVSHGGPYEDDAFVAGFQAGALDRTLAFAAMAEASTVAPGFPVYTPLVRQVELIAMNRGFPVMVVKEWEEAPDTWTYVTFQREETPDVDS